MELHRERCHDGQPATVSQLAHQWVPIAMPGARQLWTDWPVERLSAAGLDSASGDARRFTPPSKRTANPDGCVPPAPQPYPSKLRGPTCCACRSCGRNGYLQPPG